jgi:hypothetical protein
LAVAVTGGIRVPPAATGYLALGLGALALLWLARKSAAAVVSDIGEATGLKAAPEVGEHITIAGELGPLEVAGRIVSPTSSTTVALDDWTTPQYKAVVRLVANKAGKTSYKLTITEDPPLGSAKMRTLGPYVVSVGVEPTLFEHMIPRLSSLLQGSPTTTLSLTINGSPESAVVYYVGT